MVKQLEFNYKLEDFDTSAPYEDVLSIDNNFERQQAYNKLEKNANNVGVKHFFQLIVKFQLFHHSRVLPTHPPH